MTATKNINTTGMIIAGPVLGLLYAALLPFIGIAVVAKLVIEKTLGRVIVSAGNASFGWRPSESYLAGKKKNK
ncbi:MAG: hypothetical protein AB1632_11205 [Nitrospirota bacterium]